MDEDQESDRAMHTTGEIEIISNDVSATFKMMNEKDRIKLLRTLLQYAKKYMMD